MKTLGVNDFKKHIKDMDEKQLQEELLAVFKTFPEVKQYYSSKLNPKSDLELLEKYKKIITKEFTPSSSGRLSLNYKTCRDAIKDFQRICNNKKSVGELMFHYAEEGIDFTNEYGDIDEQFYNNIYRAYESTIDYVAENDIGEDFRSKAKKLMDKAFDIGWGFGEAVVDAYYNYYFEDEEE